MEQQGKNTEAEPRATPLTLAYNVLYKLQEEKGRYLTFEEVARKLGSTPGIVFKPGTTTDNILDKLEGYNMARGDKRAGLIFMLSDGPGLAPKKYTRTQSPPKCTEDEDRPFLSPFQDSWEDGTSGNYGP